MKVQARLNRYRRSAQKVREIFPVIKGLDASEALLQLEYSKRGDALDIKKLLESAVANATNNFKLNKADLFVENILAEEGKTMKRWRPRAYGRAAKILKRTCDIIITLEEKSAETKIVAKKEVKEKTVEKKPLKEAKKAEEKKAAPKEVATETKKVEASEKTDK
jgi:large subunit ribosomal protein L22